MSNYRTSDREYKPISREDFNYLSKKGRNIKEPVKKIMEEAFLQGMKDYEGGESIKIHDQFLVDMCRLFDGLLEQRAKEEATTLNA